MDVERIFSADQIEVHPALSQVLKDYTKAVVRAAPSDILAFSEEYFKEKVATSKSNAESMCFLYVGLFDYMTNPYILCTAAETTE